MTLRQPRNLAQASQLLEHYAELADAAAFLQNQRAAAIAQANAEADRALAPLLEELAALEAKLEPWWMGGGAAEAPKGRKSMQLGGCMIGVRAGRPKLAHGFGDDDKAVEALRGTRFGNQTTRAKYTLDRGAILSLLRAGNKTGEAISQLGFSIDQGENFFVERVQQDGAIGG